MSTLSKFGYLLYDDMLARIESGELDSFDIIFSKDKLVTYIISEGLKPIELRSRVYVFNSVEEAEIRLNNTTDTYVGQVISILDDNKYKGYIVNKVEDLFEVEPICEQTNIDYNTIGNRPVENLIGTLDKPIIVTNLLSGIYKIKGQYKISDLEGTTYLSADGDLFLIEDNFIKRITKDTINNYTINDGSIVKETYITDEYLLTQGYTTTTYVDAKVKALEDAINTDIQSYVESIITDKVDTIIDERLDVKLDEKIEAVPNEEVTNLFS